MSVGTSPRRAARPAPEAAPETAAEAPTPPRPDDRPGFWETLRAYAANQEPRTPTQIAAAKAARDLPDPPPDPSLPPPSFWETLRAYAADQEPRPGH